MRKLLFAGLSALSLIAIPTTASANPYYGHRFYGGGYYRHGHGDAVAAGVGGLFLGTVLGLALSQPREPRYYGPPQGYYNGQQPYYGDQGDYPQGQCFRRDLQWDPRTRQNIEVTHPHPC